MTEEYKTGMKVELHKFYFDTIGKKSESIPCAIRFVNRADDSFNTITSVDLYELIPSSIITDAYGDKHPSYYVGRMFRNVPIYFISKMSDEVFLKYCERKLYANTFSGVNSFDMINSLKLNNKPLRSDNDGDTEMETEDICLVIDKVIFNDPATIIYWKSWHYEEKVDENDPNFVEIYKVQDKTVVKCAKGEKFSKYNGFCAAVAKRVFETNSAITRIIKNAQDDSKNALKDIEKTGKKVKAQKEKEPKEKGGKKK